MERWWEITNVNFGRGWRGRPFRIKFPSLCCLSGCQGFEICATKKLRQDPSPEMSNF